MDLENVHTLFNREDPLDNNSDFNDYGDLESHSVNVDVYPLGFLRVAGNVQATGIPQCFYSALTEISRSVRKNTNQSTDPENDVLSDDPESPFRPHMPVIRSVAAQFYNYILHRTATHAGRHDSQQGTVTAALAGTFAQTKKDKDTATKKQRYCDAALPSERFHNRIHRSECPTCCRAEFVYSVDVRSLKSQTGMHIPPPLHPI